MTQYDRYILGTMFEILARLLFHIAIQVINNSEGDMVLGNLVSDYKILVERVVRWHGEEV